ncbi:MAG: c-type cytochrome [Acidobacteriota bacterium]
MGALACAFAVGNVAAQQPPAKTPVITKEAAQPIRSVNGSDVYKEYCAVCHGTDGKGKGPAAVALKGTMPDLTLLAKNAKGASPTVAIETAITGKGKLIAAHGTADMPMWGAVFNSMYGEGGARARLTNLIAYIETLQAK